MLGNEQTFIELTGHGRVCPDILRPSLKDQILATCRYVYHDCRCYIWCFARKSDRKVLNTELEEGIHFIRETSVLAGSGC